MISDMFDRTEPSSRQAMGIKSLAPTPPPSVLAGAEVDAATTIADRQCVMRAVGVVAVAMIAAAAFGEPTLTVLPGLASDGRVGVSAYGVSNGGTTVVGSCELGSSESQVHAWRWTSNGGGGTGGVDQDLGYILQPPSDPPPAYGAVAFAVSADGLVVAGASGATIDLATQSYAFRWTPQGGMRSFGYGEAVAVSGDGTVVVGFANNCCGSGPLGACRWTSDGVAHLLGGAGSIRANGCSFDGAFVTGGGLESGTESHAFRWTVVGGFQDLGTLVGCPNSLGKAVSADGSVVIGYTVGGETHSFRWTQSGLMQDLGFLPGGAEYARAEGVSADGQIVVGSSYYQGSGGTRPAAFIWSPQRGMVDLREYLIARGVDVTHMSGGATGISPDGTAIIGGGGFDECWLVRGLNFGCLELDAQPSSTVTCPGGSAVFSIIAAGTGPFTYQWQWQPEGPASEWVNLTEGDNADAGGDAVVNATNVHANTLDARPLAGSINFAPRSFRCITTNTCGNLMSNEATLTVDSTNCCPADFNTDGNLDPDDLADYIGAFFAIPPAPGSDFNADGNTDPDDLADYIGAFFAGCN